jgi:hypothetical protein
MTGKDILNKVRAIFDAPVVTEPAEPGEPTNTPVPTGVDCTLPDGTIMNCNPAPQVGAICTIDGQPAPDGEYQCTLPDGSTCTCVCAGGVCTDMKMADPVTTDVPPVPVAPAAPTMEERMAKIEEALAKLMAVPTGMSEFEAATKKIEKQDEVIKGLFELCEKLAETPTTDPQTLNGNKKEKFERRQAKETKIEGIAKAITQLKHK